jgi:hypothetical protein
MQSKPTLRAAAAAALLFFAACSTGQFNGDTAVGPGHSLTFTGYTDTPGATINIRMRHDPFNAGSAWDFIKSAPASSTLDQLAGSYPWSVTFTPDAAHFPDGKIGFFKADQTGSSVPLYSFDAATIHRCIDENSGAAVRTIGMNCARAPFDGSLALASTHNNPADLHKGVDTYNYLGFKGDAPPGGTGDYYSTINAPGTFTDFYNKYFAVPASQAGAAKYYNDYELGIARDMHCAKVASTGDIACYVGNYGVLNGNTATPDFGGDPQKALLDAITGTNKFATVAMVWKAAGGPNQVQFMAYGPDDKLAQNAKLDSTGKHTSIPNNCLNCHGINATVSFDTAAHKATINGAAAFLPFNPNALVFTTTPPYDQTYSRSAQETGLLNLNRLVEATNPPGFTKTFLASLYKGVAPSQASIPSTLYPTIPAAWAANANDKTMYSGVAQPLCLNCHMTATDPNITWDTAAKFDNVGATVPCSPQHVMPAAEQTLRRFWGSGARVYLTQRYPTQLQGTLCSQ